MSRFHGQQDFTGPKKGRKNKGVLKAYRERKRIEAEIRNEDSDPRKSKAWQRGSKYDPATGKRVPFKRADWAHYDGLIAAYAKRHGEEATVNA